MHQGDCHVFRRRNYDALSRRTLTSDTGGARTSYAYDLADRLTAVTAPSGKIIALDYDSAGRRTKVRYPNGLNTQALFETSTATGTTGRLASIAHGLNSTGQGGSALNLKLGTVGYGYDVKGNIIAANENAATPRNRAYTLDAIERLTNVKDGSGATLENYTLDEEGNRITSHLASFHVTDVANRLTEDEKHLFEYDANGNMVRKTVKASGATWRYSYTVWDELTSASRHASADGASPVTDKVSYTFDALGRRVAERRYDGGGALTGGTNFHYDGEEVAHEVQVDATGAVIAGSAKWTTHSDGVDDLLSVTPQAGTGPVSPTAVTTGAAMPSSNGYYYHTDHQGSVRAITDQSGTITNAYAYDSYGTAEESVESLAQRFRYTGREFDALTGLYHYRARAYDPETARFLQEDPLWFEAGDLNIYRMTWNNPVNWVDPSGMSGTEYGATTTPIMQTMSNVAAIGYNLGCKFVTFAGAVTIAGDVAAMVVDIDPIYMETVNAIADTGALLGCGVKFSKVKKRPNPCGGKSSILEKVDFLFSIFGGIKTLNSFEAGTLVLTPDGLKPIEAIRTGNLVAARDELTGRNVWRKVTETYNRQAPDILSVSMEAGDGKVTIVSVTSEHPFHLQDWDGKVETMVAALGKMPALDAARIFPSDGKTPFGEWVKAGALKVGDQISTRSSAPFAEALGPRFVANYNQPLTVTDIIRDNRATRVYNFEVESGLGEITHNYFVGDEHAWVHNAKFSAKRAREAWQRYWNRDWPLDSDGKPLQVHHDEPVCEVPSRKYDPTNIIPMFKFGHRLLHSMRGDFSRWGGGLF